MPDNVVNISNQQKYENYREQFKRLKRALTSGFYLEAIFIEYAILEDRTESVLRHADLWDSYQKSRKGHDPNINSKVKYIQKRAENKKAVLHKYFSDDLLSRIISWKDARNRLIHALLKQQLEHDEIKELAVLGDELVKTLRSRSNSYKRAIEMEKVDNRV